jgi:microcystin-dependent protein
VTQLQNATPSGVPTGTIAIWMTLSIPTGWILCEGQNLVSPEHDDLIAVLG